MQITLHHRTFPVAGAPEALSLVPFPAHQRHTYPHDGTVYEAVCCEIRVVVPDGATIDPLRNLLSWAGAKGTVKSSAKEVFEMAQARAPGFRPGK